MLNLDLEFLCFFSTSSDYCDRAKMTYVYANTQKCDPFSFYFSESGEKVLLKTTNLSVLNILQLYNKHVSSLVPPSQAALEAKEAFLEKKRKRKRPPKIREGSKHRGVRL